jgi:DNA-binding MurR/RpiR family transcriptional regulator
MAMNDLDRQFVEDVINASAEEFDEMLDELSDTELHEVLALIREAKAEVIEQELDALESRLTSMTQAGIILQRIKRGSY